MQTAKKRSFLANSQSSPLPPGCVQVQYLKKTRGYGTVSGGEGSYFISKSAFNWVQGDYLLVFSFSSGASSEVQQDRKLCGSSSSSTSISEYGAVANNDWISNKFRGYPFCGTYDNNLGITQLKTNVVYCVGADYESKRSFSETSENPGVRQYFSVTWPTSATVINYKVLGGGEHAATRAPKNLRVHRFTFTSHTEGIDSIDMIPVNYNGTPCFYDLYHKEFCYEIGGTGYWSCGPIA